MVNYGVFTGSGIGSVGSVDIFTRRWVFPPRTGGVSSSAWGGHYSHAFIGSGGGGGGGILAIFARGGCIPPMSSSGAAATSAAAATSFRGGGIPAAVPAAGVTGGTHVSGSGVGPPAVVGAAPTPPVSDPFVAAGTDAGELLATEHEQLVTSGGRREVLAEVSRMAGGTSPVGPGASGPPDMVHAGGAGGRWQIPRVTPAVTRSWAKRDGL